MAKAYRPARNDHINRDARLGSYRSCLIAAGITPEVSAYGSYSRSFGSANGFTASNTALPPEKALQWEFGLKAQVLKDVSATLAFFQIGDAL